jgi:hypothetical protein
MLADGFHFRTVQLARSHRIDSRQNGSTTHG